ncbi:MAG: hypothetical protein FWE47_04410 [Oscillospiraceae bacterium]|nr:hypothetical protein [Oscillospiraceae bacterium]
MNTVREPNITQIEYEEALKELYKALIPLPSTRGENKPWEEFEEEVRDRYGF